MTQRTRRKIDAALKAKIALEALREQATVFDLAQHYQAPHPDLRLEETWLSRPTANGRSSGCMPRSAS